MTGATVRPVPRPNATCALLFFGLPKCFAHKVLPSVRRHILGPNPGCDVYAHTFRVDAVENPRNGEKAAPLKWDEIFQLVPDAATDAPEAFEASMNLTYWRQFYPHSVGGAWTYPLTIDNMYKQWLSIQRAWTAMARGEAQRGAPYGRVGLFRSDVLYKTDVDVQRGDAVVPGFGWFPGNNRAGMSDRMFYGLRRHAETWASRRLQHVADYLARRPSLRGEIHSESLSLDRMRHAPVTPDRDLCFLRVRATCWVEEDDCDQMPAPPRFGTEDADAFREVRARTFVHVPKAGGSSAAAWLRQRALPSLRARDGDGTFPWTLPPESHHPGEVRACNYDAVEEMRTGPGCCSRWHIPPRLFADFEPATPLLLTVRDPEARAVSEALWDMPNETATEVCRDASTFSRAVNDQINYGLGEYDRDPYAKDCHWLPQWHYAADRVGGVLPNVSAIAVGRADRVFNGLPHVVPGRLKPQCDTSQVVLSADIKQKLRERYARDYALFDMLNRTTAVRGTVLTAFPPAVGPPPRDLVLCVVARVRDDWERLGEFAEHYREEGFDEILVLADRADPPAFARGLPGVRFLAADLHEANPNGTILGKARPINEAVAAHLGHCRWVASMDVDELLTTRARPGRTVREELADLPPSERALKVPWLVFESKSRSRPVKSVRRDMLWRWNQTRAHSWARFDDGLVLRDTSIVKPVYDPRECELFTLHTVQCTPRKEGWYGYRYLNLTEAQVPYEPLAVHHYRYPDNRDIQRKCSASGSWSDSWTVAGYGKNMSTTACVEGLANSWHPDVYDRTMLDKMQRRQGGNSSTHQRAAAPVWVHGEAPIQGRMHLNGVNLMDAEQVRAALADMEFPNIPEGHILLVKQFLWTFSHQQLREGYPAINPGAAPEGLDDMSRQDLVRHITKLVKQRQA